MTAQPTTTTGTTTTSPRLTATQARALLQTLLSTTTPSTTTNPPRTRPTPNPTPLAPKPSTAKPPRQPQPPQQPSPTHTITIDASTRIMGHCNNIQLSTPSAPEQAVRINELVQAAVVGASQGNGAAINVTVNAGFNLMGSKNVVLIGSSTAKRAEALAEDDLNGGGSSSPGKTEQSSVGRKRRVEDSFESDESAGKKVKCEEESREGMEA